MKAREVLKGASKEQRTSKDNAMLAYLKDNPCPSASSSRQEERQMWIEKFVVLQMQSKSKSSNFTTQLQAAKTDMIDVHYWAKEQMQKELGPNRTHILPGSGLLNNRPCSLTGQDSEWVREYRIPVDWSRMSNEDLKRWTLQVDGPAAEEEFEAMKKKHQRGVCFCNRAGTCSTQGEG